MDKSAPKKPDSLYAKLFAKAYDPVMHKLEERLLLPKRRALISHARGKVLEVGAGTGINFPLYSQDLHILAIEPSKTMMEQAAQRLLQEQVMAKIELLQAGVHDDRLQRLLSPGSLDAIVCTLVLCTIPDWSKAIAQFHEWLRPGGQLLVLEHIHDHRQPQRWLQHRLTPVWKRLAEGCHLNRSTDKVLKASSFDLQEEEYFETSVVPFYWARFIK
jgi:ubiquinone/menaquinone biosynthesis C-methylase UbiE